MFSLQVPLGTYLSPSALVGIPQLGVMSRGLCFPGVNSVSMQEKRNTHSTKAMQNESQIVRGSDDLTISLLCPPFSQDLEIEMLVPKRCSLKLLQEVSVPPGCYGVSCMSIMAEGLTVGL